MSADQTASPRRSNVARGTALLLVASFVALLAYGLLSKAPEGGINESLRQARPAPAPAFELPVLQRGELGPRLSKRLRGPLADGRLALAETRGSPIVLNFWASWCPPCRVEAPRLERAWRRARENGVLFLGLNMQDVTEDARDFVGEFELSYLNVRDRSNDVATDWGVTGLPETFFLSARGQVVGHVIGAISEDQLRDGVRAAASGRVLGARSGGDRRPTR
jgi:cytochrome c biogenesis protein CcmG/thiol:disulfide interchange protein DsbE